MLYMLLNTKIFIKLFNHFLFSLIILCLNALNWFMYYNVKQELITNSHILRSSDLDMKFNMKNLCIEPHIVFLHTFHLTLNTESTVRSDLILIVQADVFAGECLDGWNIAAGQYRYSGCSLRGHHCCWSCNGTLVVPLHSHPPSIYNRVTPTTLPLLLSLSFSSFSLYFVFG